MLIMLKNQKEVKVHKVLEVVEEDIESSEYFQSKIKIYGSILLFLLIIILCSNSNIKTIRK